jgi:hypothetical protein
VAYTRGVPPNKALDVVNLFGIDLGAPGLASSNRIVATHTMSRAAMTIANASAADGLARNVTVTGTQAGGADDTGATVHVVGTNVDGDVITEDIVPVNGSTVAGAKAFKTVTAVSQPAWVIGGTTADTLVVGVGNKVGMPSSLLRGNGRPDAANKVILVVLGGAIVAPTVAWDIDEPEKNTVDASAGTYDGTKLLTAILRR